MLLLKRLLEFFPSSDRKKKKKVKHVPLKATVFRKVCHDFIHKTSLRGFDALRNMVLTTFLSSFWDETRLSACQITIVFDEIRIDANTQINNSHDWNAASCRRMCLSSSPRQRESDMGARLLATHHKTLCYNENYNLLELDLLPLLQDRLNDMEKCLGLKLEECNNSSK